MPNILLTTRCNLACKYCFAQAKLAGRRENMSLDNVRTVIDRLKGANYPVFRVMGGEPTLHPQFNEIIGMALAEGMRVDVLSNATWSESCAELFARISPTRLLFLLNVDHPDQYPASLWRRIQQNLEGLKYRRGVTLSFNVFEKNPRSDYILDIASRFGFQNIRLSLSLPVFGANNTFLPIETLPEVAPFVVRFARQAEAQGITIQFDNAVPLCMFTEEQAGWLLLHGVLDPKRNARCEPIIDIGPDLTIWSCFCLSQLANRNLTEFATLSEARDYFVNVWSVYQDSVFPMEKCYTCVYRQKWGCQGGCLSYAIAKDNGQRYNAALPAQVVGDGSCFDPERCLALADDVTLAHYDLPEPTYLLHNKSTGVDFEVLTNLYPLLPLLDGHHTTPELVQAFTGISGPGSLQTFMGGVAAESLPQILAGLVQQGFLKQVVRA